MGYCNTDRDDVKSVNEFGNMLVVTYLKETRRNSLGIVGIVAQCCTTPGNFRAACPQLATLRPI